MERNVGGLDRTARIVVGSILVLAAAAAVLGELAVSAIVTAAAVVVGLIMLITGTTRKCPANRMLGVDTSKK